MEALRELRGRLPVPVDFLTTVTANTFRKQYYFEKKASVLKAVEVHRKYAMDPDEYMDMVRRVLPVMLDSHKILSALFIFDATEVPANIRNEMILEILLETRPDMVPDFWLSFLEFGGELGLRKTSLGSLGRKLVWRYINAQVERLGMRRVVMQLLKEKRRWSEVFYRAHAHMEGPMEDFVGHILFGRDLDPYKPLPVGPLVFLKDLKNIASLAKSRKLTHDDIRGSTLPFRTLEGYASQAGIQTDHKDFYRAAFHTMTAYEKLRRTDAMMRTGFIEENFDMWLGALKSAARVYDPVDVASVMLQHPDLRGALVEVLAACLEESMFKFPADSVVLVDGSRSMKLMEHNARPRCIWELVGLMAAEQGVPTYVFRDTAEALNRSVESAIGIAEAFGEEEAYNPTNISAGLEEARKHGPEWVFLVTDGQSNIPYRGHEKTVAERMDATIVTLNPTINPLEPEAATGIGSKNEILLPVRGIRFLRKMMEVIT